jgi:hypothetical protein
MDDVVNAAKAHPNAATIALSCACVYPTYGLAMDNALKLRAELIQIVQQTHHVLVNTEREKNEYYLRVLLIRRLVK